MKKTLLFLISVTLATVGCSAQQEKTFEDGEFLSYDLHYKYGLLMLKAATADFSIKTDEGNNPSDPVYQAGLSFKTTSFFDRIFKIRDTLQSNFRMPFEPLYSIRNVHEGNSDYREEIIFNTFTPDYSEARVIRATATRIKVDTVLHSENPAFDILSVLVFARAIDYDNIAKGYKFNITNFISNEAINIIARYEGTEKIETRANKTYQTYKLNIDISDKAFKESKSAMEVWVSADAKRYPVKIKAKLKIGAGEAELASVRTEPPK